MRRVRQGRPRAVFVVLEVVGALTLKPSAYAFRPWEVFTRTAPDFFDYAGDLTLGVRGARVVRVAQSGWLRDRIRFCYDGFRRQRLVRPHRRALPVGWALGLAEWYAQLAYTRPLLAAGPSGESGWLRLVAARVTHSGGLLVGCVYDANRVGRVFYGPFGLAAAAVSVALPTGLDYEDLGATPGPVGVPTGAQLAAALAQPVRSSLPGWRLDRGVPRVWAHPAHIRVTRSVLQVSPLQRMLTNASG